MACCRRIAMDPGCVLISHLGREILLRRGNAHRFQVALASSTVRAPSEAGCGTDAWYSIRRAPTALNARFVDGLAGSEGESRLRRDPGLDVPICVRSVYGTGWPAQRGKGCQVSR